jgi:hypothetical protein
MKWLRKMRSEVAPEVLTIVNLVWRQRNAFVKLAETRGMLVVWVRSCSLPRIHCNAAGTNGGGAN